MSPCCVPGMDGLLLMGHRDITYDSKLCIGKGRQG